MHTGLPLQYHRDLKVLRLLKNSSYIPQIFRLNPHESFYKLFEQ